MRKYWFYWLVRSSGWFVTKIYNRLSSEGSRNLPKEGPVLVVANHSSNLDPPIVAFSFLHRPLMFMGKAELWEKRWLGKIIEALGCFPVQRDAAADKRAIVSAIRCLKDGEALLLFPEGTRTPDGTIQQFHPGAARIALAVPGTRILPVRIHGAFDAMGRGAGFPKPRKIRVVVGDAFDPNEIKGLPDDKKSLYQAVTDEMFRRISALE